MDSAIYRRLAQIWSAIARPVMGAPACLPQPLGERWPELTTVRWRRGGLPPRIGGWCLGRSTVDGITLWGTVYLAPGAPWEPGLLLHERRHVEQFASSAVFPFLYLYESLRVGYSQNRFEADANAWAAMRCGQVQHITPSLGA